MRRMLMILCLTGSLGFSAVGSLAQNVLDRVEFSQGIQQLQSIADLQTSLTNNGQPPVTLVANRDTVLRLYPLAGSGNVGVSVKLPSGLTVSVNRAYAATCTTAVQRVWNVARTDCRSIDINFVPPKGNWTVTVSATAGFRQDNLTFTFTNSPLQRELEILSSPVCSQKVINPVTKVVTWQSCGDPNTAGLFSYKDIFPTHQAPRGSRQKVLVDRSAFPLNDAGTESFYNKILEQLNVVHLVDAINDLIKPPPLVRRRVYVGVVSGATNVSYSGQAVINSSRATVVDTFDFLGNAKAANWISSHEIGHALGLFHTNTGLPAAVGTGVQNGCELAEDTTAAAAAQWPYANNRIQSGPAARPVTEVGFDLRGDVSFPAVFPSAAVADRTKIYEIMGYCQPQWISPIKYNVTLASLGPNAVLPPEFGGDRTSSNLAPGYWQVSGSIAEGNATLDPLFTFPAGGTTDAGSGAYAIQVLDGSNNVLFQRNFDLDETVPEDPAGSSDSVFSTFFQVIPMQSGAQKIVLLDPEDTVLATINPSGRAPNAIVTGPLGGQTISGLTPVIWAIGAGTVPCSSNPTPVTSRVQYSADGGVTWAFLGDVTDTSMLVDFDQLPGSMSSYSSQIEVTVSDGCHVGSAKSSSFNVTHKLPQDPAIVHLTPYHAPYDVLGLEGIAYDGDDGLLSGNAISWSSNIDGFLGTGSRLNAGLTAGNHTITMTATDSDDNPVSTTAQVSVAQGPPQLGVTIYPDSSNPECVDITMTAVPDPYVPLYGVEYSLDGGDTLTFVPSSDLPFTYVIHSPGTFNFLAAAMDQIGQQDVGTATITTGPGCH